MGYAHTNIVFYGVELPKDIAKKIWEDPKYNNSKEGIFTIPGPRFYRALDFSHSRVQRLSLTQATPVTPYTEHNKDIQESEIIFPELISDGTDSRIHNLHCDVDDGYTSFLGVFIASKGYAYEDKINAFAQRIPPEAITVFKAAIAPILAQYGITQSPELQIIGQVW